LPPTSERVISVTGVSVVVAVSMRLALGQERVPPVNESVLLLMLTAVQLDTPER
jgi:hypothetical protein